MIEIPRPPFDFANPRLKVFALGSAACNALDRIALDGLPDADLVAINTDAQALATSLVETKLQIGQTITRGLGAGGDPDVGRTAAEEGIGEILGTLADATVVFLLVALGGGTGSGAAPVIAEITREHNAMVVVFATLPFRFEGKRRMAQAMESLAALHRVADIVICFENDKMGDAVGPDANVREAFATADETINQSVRALAGMARRRGPVHAGFDEVASTVRGDQMRALFGFGSAQGADRGNEALLNALRNPLLDHGRRLQEAENVFVHILGGPDLKLSEVEQIMLEANRYIPETARIFFGASIDPVLEGGVTVTVMSAVPAELPAEAVEKDNQRRAALEVSARPPEDLGLIEDEEFLEPAYAEEVPAEEEVVAEAEPPVQHSLPKPPSIPAFAGRPVRPMFSTMRKFRPPASGPAPAPVPADDEPPHSEKTVQKPFDSVNRGRFEKSEPTIVDGQDLDVPTFMRRNLRK